MTQSPIPPNKPSNAHSSGNHSSSNHSSGHPGNHSSGNRGSGNHGGYDRSGDRSNDSDIAQTIIQQISKLSNLKDYPIRDLVQHCEKLGPELKRKKLETNQIRKFLDAINQIKADLSNRSFEDMEVEVVLLKPKLAYAAARQDAVKLLSKVISAAIDKVRSKEDFERLVQLMESIIAYHKAVEGK
jgi:CRISPR-associated protein Csm2